MNAFELEKYLLEMAGEEVMKPEKKPKISAGHAVSEATDSNKFPIYHAKYTRPIMSIFEYVAAIRMVATDLDSQKSASKYLDDFEVKNFINPSFLAFYIIDKGKWDGVILRNGNEKVSFSTLYINPRWREQILDLIEKKNLSMDEEFKPIYDLITADEK